MNLLSNGYIHYDNWITRRKEIWSSPQEQGIFRIDLELSNPTDFLLEVKTDKNPHSFVHQNTVYYVCDEWTSSYDIIEAKHPLAGNSLRFLAESSRNDPALGERFILYSSSGYLLNEPWEQQKPNLYAFIRDKFWFVNFHECNFPWKPSTNYPLVDQQCDWSYGFNNDDWSKDDFLYPTYLSEKEDNDLASFMKSIFIEFNPFSLLVCFDWLEDNYNVSKFVDYLRKITEIIFSNPDNFNDKINLMKTVWDNRCELHLP